MSESPQLDPDVRAYYEEGREAARLRTGEGRLEFLRTQELLARYLPPAPATVVDVGGGAGIHAIPLATRGYAIHLIDAVELHLEQARVAAADVGASLASIAIGDARRLDCADASADAVLLLGPLYHLTEHRDRLTALRETARVLRPGGVLVAAAISRFAGTYDSLRLGFLAEPGAEDALEREVRKGQHRNPTCRPGWFTTSYFHLPPQLVDEVSEVGLTVDALLAVEGVGWLTPNLNEWLDDEPRRELLLRTIRRVEAEPSILGASAHFVAIARKA